MELNIEELAQKEVTRLVEEKLNKKLHLQIQKELKNHDYSNIVRQHTINEVGKFVKEIDIVKFINLDKLQKDVTDNVTKVLIDRLTSSYVEHEEYDWD